MATRIVNLDELVPEEITFRWKGADYRLPGDIDTETTFTLQQLLVEMGEAEAAVLQASADGLDAKNGAQGKRASSAMVAAQGRQRRVTAKVEKEILRLFQTNHPDMEKLPFGVVGFTIVLTYVLTELGFGEMEQDPTPPPPNRQTRRAAKKTARSTPSPT